MPNSRRSSHEASRSDHTLVGAESSRRREVRILSVRLKKESLPLESTVWWMLLCAVSHYHRRQSDARRMEMVLEDKNVITGGTSSTSPVGRCPASDLLP